jgi:hypothetical protein
MAREQTCMSTQLVAGARTMLGAMLGAMAPPLLIASRSSAISPRSLATSDACAASQRRGTGLSKPRA